MRREESLPATSTPISSRTSRVAHSISDSFWLILPRGNDQERLWKERTRTHFSKEIKRKIIKQNLGFGRVEENAAANGHAAEVATRLCVQFIKAREERFEAGVELEEFEAKCFVVQRWLNEEKKK
jgi:hypothetical protein